MKTQNTFAVSFFLKKDKQSKGLAPLYARITVNGIFCDLSSKRKVKILSWNQKEQKLKGNSEEDLIVKEKIRLLRNDINAAYDGLIKDKRLVTAETVKAKAERLDTEPYTLKWLIKQHNEVWGKLLEEGTLKNYRTTERLIDEFLITKKKKDIYRSTKSCVFTEFILYIRLRKPDRVSGHVVIIQ